MKKLQDITPNKYKHLLYKDEINDQFILTNHFEIFMYNSKLIKCYTFTRKATKYAKEVLKIKDMPITSDICQFVVESEKISDLIELGATKRRIHKNGQKLKYLEEKIGHRIIPFNPKLSGE